MSSQLETNSTSDLNEWELNSSANSGTIFPTIVPVINGAIKVGGLSERVLGEAPTCTYVEIANYSNGDIWIQFDGAAGIDNGFKIAAGQPNWRSPSQLSIQLSINIFGATTGQKYAIITN